jgi:hypothetical protein
MSPYRLNVPPRSKVTAKFVMPGLVPGIHVLIASEKDVDGRDEARP